MLISEKCKRCIVHQTAKKMFKVKRMTLCFDWYRNLQDHDLKYNLGLYNAFVQIVILVT